MNKTKKQLFRQYLSKEHTVPASIIAEFDPGTVGEADEFAVELNLKMGKMFGLPQVVFEAEPSEAFMKQVSDMFEKTKEMIQNLELLRDYKHTKRKKNLKLKHTHSRKAIFLTAVNEHPNFSESPKWEIYLLKPAYKGKTLVCVSALNRITWVERIFETLVFPAKHFNGKFAIVGFLEIYAARETNNHQRVLKEMGYRIIGR